MKTTFAILTCLAAATTALVIPPTDQVPLVQDEMPASAAPATSTKNAAAAAAAASATLAPAPAPEQVEDFPVLLIIRPSDVEKAKKKEEEEKKEKEALSGALPPLVIDGPTERDVHEAEVVVGEYDKDEENLGSCFCAGGAVCCLRDGETDCGFGACGI